MDGKHSPITVQEITRECKDGPTSEQSASNTIGRVRVALTEYFEQNPPEPIRVELETQTHILRFTRNRASSERVAKFWKPYFASFATTVLYYPEPQFFRHRNGTYIVSVWSEPS